MRETALNNLVDNTFQKIANPLKGNGMYAEIQKAIMEAYALGKKGKRMLAQQLTEESLQGMLAEQ